MKFHQMKIRQIKKVLTIKKSFVKNIKKKQFSSKTYRNNFCQKRRNKVLGKKPLNCWKISGKATQSLLIKMAFGRFNQLVCTIYSKRFIHYYPSSPVSFCIYINLHSGAYSTYGSGLYTLRLLSSTIQAERLPGTKIISQIRKNVWQGLIDPMY